MIFGAWIFGVRNKDKKNKDYSLSSDFQESVKCKEKLNCVDCKEEKCCPFSRCATQKKNKEFAYIYTSAAQLPFAGATGVADTNEIFFDANGPITSCIKHCVTRDANRVVLNNSGFVEVTYFVSGTGVTADVGTQAYELYLMSDECEGANATAAGVAVPGSRREPTFPGDDVNGNVKFFVPCKSTLVLRAIPIAGSVIVPIPVHSSGAVTASIDVIYLC